MIACFYSPDVHCFVFSFAYIYHGNSSKNILRPMLRYLLLCCFRKQATYYSRIGQNVNSHPPYKAMLCPNDNFPSKYPPQHTNNIALSVKGVENQCGLRTFVRDCSFVLVIQKRCDGHRLSRFQGRSSTSGHRRSGTNLKRAGGHGPHMTMCPTANNSVDKLFT